MMSLHQRLLLSALLVVVLLTPLTGYGLVYALRLTLTESFDATVQALLNVAVASLEENELGELSWQDRLADGRFQQLQSGWYWQVEDSEQVLFRSPSLFDQRLALDANISTGMQVIAGPGGDSVRAHTITIRRAEHPLPLRVTVAGNAADIEDSLDFFEWLTVAGLLTFSGLLMLLLAGQIRWGLRPLRQLQKQVANLSAHQNIPENTRLPKELQDLANAIHAALERNEKLLAHSRLTAGNLAHALKTPLTVLQSYAESLPADSDSASFESEASKQQWLDEINRMHFAIQHHLARASAVGDGRIHRSIDVASTLQPVLAALRVMAKNQEIVLHEHISAQAQVQIDGQDLQELVGNLVENAIYHGGKTVWLHCTSSSLQVRDDGPGIAEEQKEQILLRGVRIDERAKGSGLGLSIVADIAEIYGFAMHISALEPHGTEVTIEFANT